MNLTDAIKEIKGIDYLKRVVEDYGVKIKKSTKGSLKGCCPMHSEKTPSFYLKSNGSESYYKCFGCHAGGDIVKFIQAMEGLTTLEATKEAYNILGLKFDFEPSKLDRLIDNIETKEFYKIEGFYIESIHTYMIDENTPSFLKIKYRSQNDNSKKDLRTYKIVDEGEYFKTTTKSKGGEYIPTIYNYPKIKNAIEKDNNIYIVEGEKDADNLQRLGFVTTTVYGKKWEDRYTEQLKGSKVVFIGDSGEAGDDFKQFIYENLKDVVKTFRVVDLPGLEELGDNKDVSDWLNIKENTKDDLIEAIKNSWDYKISEKWADVTIKEVKDMKIVSPKKTLRNFEIMLKRANTSIYLNEISKLLEIRTDKFENKNLNTFATEIYSYCQIEGLGLSPSDVMKYIDAIGYKRTINPFKEFLDGLDKWDGKDWIKEFCDIFITNEKYDKNLKELILKKWLLQFMGSAYDNEFKSPGLVVLKGPQGIGKSSIFNKLIPINEPWVHLQEQHFTGDRDNIQTITSNQIVEFSEFARSNKAVDALKAFVTSKVDKMVLKYDKYPVEHKRKTVYYATVNDDEFLIDDENRRFWVIDLIGLNLNHSVNFNQMWSQLYHMYHNEGIKEYWLNQEEQSLIEKSNQNYKFKGELETCIEKAFDFTDSTRLWLTSIEVAEYLNKDISKTKITRTLKSMGIKQEAKNNKDMPRNTYNCMPIPKFWRKEIPKDMTKRLITPLTIVPKEHTQEYIIEEQAREIQLLKQHIQRLQAELSNIKIDLDAK